MELGGGPSAADALGQTPKDAANLTKPANFEIQESKDIAGLQGKIEWKIPVEENPGGSNATKNSLNVSFGMSGHSLTLAPLLTRFKVELFNPAGALAKSATCEAVGMTLMGGGVFCALQYAQPNVAVGNWVVRFSPSDPVGEAPSVSHYALKATVTY